MSAALTPVPRIPGRHQSPHISAQPSNPYPGHAGELVAHTEEERDESAPHLPPHLLLIPPHHGPQQVPEEPEGELSQPAVLLPGGGKGQP